MPEKIKKLGQFFAVASHSRTLSLLIMFLIVAAVPLTVFVAQKQQEVRQRAEGINENCKNFSDDNWEYNCYSVNNCENIGMVELTEVGYPVCNNASDKCCRKIKNTSFSCPGPCVSPSSCTVPNHVDTTKLCEVEGEICCLGPTRNKCEDSTTASSEFRCLDYFSFGSCSAAGEEWQSSEASCPTGEICCYRAIPIPDSSVRCEKMSDSYTRYACFDNDIISDCLQLGGRIVSGGQCSSGQSCCAWPLYSTTTSTPTPTPKSGSKPPVVTGGTGGTGGGIKCEHSGTKYNPGDKRWECTNPKTKGPCTEGEGVGVPFVCNNDTAWSNANPSGECSAECRPEAGSVTQNNCETLKIENATFKCYPGACPSSGNWNTWNANCPSDAKCCVQYQQTGSGGTGTSGTGGTTSGSAPACDNNQVQMSFSPNSPKSGDTIVFNVTGSQGSTYINDVWSPDGGVDCSGGFWGGKECKAKKEGTYKWTHKWKNCASGNCGVTSSECSKELSFTIAANSTPTTASCPALTVSDAPSELKYTCDTANKKINLSWKAPSNANITSYSIRVDKDPSSFNGNCSSPSTGDSCADPTTTAYTIENIDPNAAYRVWIHSRDKCGSWSPIAGTKAEITFSCKPLSLNLQAYWIDGSDWTPNAPRIDLIVRDYVINGEKVCVPEEEKNNIEIYNSETGAKIGLLKNYQTVPSGGYQPGKSDYNCGAYMDWGKHTAFRLFGTKQQLKDKGLPNKIKFKIPNYTSLSNEVELITVNPSGTQCSILNGSCGYGINGQLLGTCCGGLRCDSHPDGGICKNAGDVKANPDVDRDGCIGQKDIDLWLRAYQKTDQPPYPCPAGYTCKENNKYYPDINNDNKINLLDFSEWVNAIINREKPCS